MHLPGRPKRDHNVIACAEFEIAELRSQYAAAFMYPPGLVSLRVAIKIIHAFGDARNTQNNIPVCEQRNARRDGIPSERRIRSLEGTVTDRAEVHGFGQARAEVLRVLHAR